MTAATCLVLACADWLPHGLRSVEVSDCHHRTNGAAAVVLHRSSLVSPTTKSHPFKLTLQTANSRSLASATTTTKTSLSSIMSLNIQTTLSAPSDRVKSVQYHPTQPWILTGLITGLVEVRNSETNALVLRWQVTDTPVRTAKFIARRNWIVAGADDRKIRVFDITAGTQIAVFEAHQDYIRFIEVHPTQPKIISCADDRTVKVWDWGRSWECVQVLLGHTHYVMMARFHPTNNNQVVSASLDKTIRLWSMAGSDCIGVLEGHTNGINCVAFDPTGQRLVSGGDDHTVRIWDVKTRTLLHTLEGHTANVTAALFHPELSIVASASEDGAVRVWDSSSFAPQTTISQGLARAWALAARESKNELSVGYDSGMVALELTRGGNAIPVGGPNASRL